MDGGPSARREAPIKIQHAAENRPKTQGEGMTIDQLMRRIAVQLQGIIEKLEHPNDNDARRAAVMAKSTLDDLHEAAAKLRAVRRELGVPEDKP